MVLGWILGRILLWKILELEEKTLDELENYPPPPSRGVRMV